jgi:Lipocalin-like domain
MRRDLPQGATGEPAAGDRIVQTYVAYVGTYTLDGKKLAVKVNGATRADWLNTTRVTTVEKLTLSELVLVNEASDQKVTQSATRCSAR